MGYNGVLQSETLQKLCFYCSLPQIFHASGIQSLIFIFIFHIALGEKPTVP